MATLGHVAVGLAAARVYRAGRMPQWSAAIGWSALAVLPDLDLIGFGLGVPYNNAWGHRGATHSLPLAIVVGLAVGAAARWFKREAGRTTRVACIVAASHGLLDTLTNGGLGCALLWPFDLTRYFAPWRPIPVAPIGFDLFSPYGAIVFLAELAFFGPLLVYALRSPTAARTPILTASFAGLWIVCVWLMSSSDPVREAIVGFMLREKTRYAPGFSEGAFGHVEPGASARDVRRLLGAPHGESWFYPLNVHSVLQPAGETSAASLRPCRAFRFEDDVVMKAFDPDACRSLGIAAGARLDEVHRLLGDPNEMCWHYSWSPGFAYRMRMVCFADKKVEAAIRGWAMSERQAP